MGIEYNMVVSIMNRITGIALAFGFAGFALLSLPGIGGGESLPNFIEGLKGYPVLYYPIAAGLAFSGSYHTTKMVYFELLHPVTPAATCAVGTLGFVVGGVTVVGTMLLLQQSGAQPTSEAN